MAKYKKIGGLFLILVMGLSSIYWSTFKQNSLGEIKEQDPIVVGDTVEFKIINYTGDEPINVAWDFGDGSGLSDYFNDSVIKFAYKEPGIYEVFARFKDEVIPATHTQTVINELNDPRPVNSSTIKIDEKNEFVWAVNQDNNSIVKIDAKELKRVGEYEVGENPRSLALDKKGNVWVVNQNDFSVWILNNEGKVEKKIDMPYASRPFGICIDPKGENAYVTLQAVGKLAKIGVEKTEVIEIIEIGTMPRGIAISSNSKELYITRFISPAERGEVVKVLADPFKKDKVIPLAYDKSEDTGDNGRGVPNFMSSITIRPDGKVAWVPSKKDNTARGLWRDGQKLNSENTVRTITSQINLEKGEEDLSGRLDYTDHDMAYAVTFSPYGNLAFVAFQGNNEIEVVNVFNRARLSSIDSTGLSPQGLVFNSDGSKLFVHNFLTRSIAVYDTYKLVRSYSTEAPKLAEINTVEKEKLDEETLLGKQIFYNSADKRMTKDGYISCASCHLEGMSDERVWDFTERGEGLRNTHFIIGRAGMGMGPVHWTSNFDEIQDFENDIRGGFDGKGFMSDDDFNEGTRNDPLGDPKAGISAELDALAKYVTSLSKVNPSPYRNQDGSLTDDAKAGKEIYIDLGCQACHSGKMFTDRTEFKFALHDVGTITDSSGKRRNEPLTGFGTPTLKGVWETAPYLHDGTAKTLHEVFTKRNEKDKHGATSKLNEKELDQLVAYLKSIDESSDIIGVDEHSSFGNAPIFKAYPTVVVEGGLIEYSITNLKEEGTLTLTNIKGQVLEEIPISGQSSEVKGRIIEKRKGVLFLTLRTKSHQLTKQLIIQ